MAVLQPIFASFNENILPMRLQLIIGFLLAAASMGIFTLMTTDFYVFTMIIIFATGGAMVTPNLIASISFIDENNTGTYLSTQSSTNSIGQVLGPLFGMWIYSFGSSWPFLIIGIILLLVTLFTMPGLKFNK
jgi:DHA1 family multidrug resistance protein-like MFS transporter